MHFFFFKQKTAYEISACLVGSEMCIRDRGMMFGYACDETPELMPFPIQMAHSLVHYLAKVRKGGEAYFLRPDSKSQVTVEYRDGKPVKVKNVVISTQHSADVEHSKLKETIIDGVIRAVIPAEYPVSY